VRRIVIALLAAAAVAAAQKAAQPSIDKKKLEGYLRHLELWVPQITVEIGDPKPSNVPGLSEVKVHLTYGAATKDINYYLSRDGQQLLRAEVYPLGTDPFTADRKLIQTEGHPSFGPASAPLTIAVFSDFECPVCRQEAKTLRDNVSSKFPSDVQVVFFDMPLDAIHNWARPAAIAGRCVYDQNHDAFWYYFDWMYEHQGDIKAENLKDKIMEWAGTAKNIDAGKLTRCMDNKSTEAEVNKSVEAGKALQVDSTPTSFLNGRRLVGAMPWENLEKVIGMDLEYAKSHAK
jgi:protein-disulfide isomerase